MQSTIEPKEWSQFLKNYSDLNHGRLTRLGVFQMDGETVSDYWIEDGLPLVAVDVYPNHGKIRVDFLFESFTHSVEGVEKIVSLNGDATVQGLDISDADGNTTQLRFEDWSDQKE